jgi:two-component system phosphate regulon response regulator PhoB
MRLRLNNRPVVLSPTAFRLMHFFITHPERVYSRAQLLDGVWGDSSEIDERTVDVIVRRLRRQLEPFGCRDYIQTVRSIGYRFSALIN